MLTELPALKFLDLAKNYVKKPGGLLKPFGIPFWNVKPLIGN